MWSWKCKTMVYSRSWASGKYWSLFWVRSLARCATCHSGKHFILFKVNTNSSVWTLVIPLIGLVHYNCSKLWVGDHRIHQSDGDYLTVEVVCNNQFTFDVIFDAIYYGSHYMQHCNRIMGNCHLNTNNFLWVWLLLLQ